MRRHHDADPVLQLRRLVGRGGGLALHHGIGLDDLHDHGFRKRDRDHRPFIARNRHHHAFLEEHGRFADQLGIERDLLVGLLLHEGVVVAGREQILVFVLVQAHALDRLRGAEALVQLGTGADVLKLDLEIGTALARLGVHGLDRAPELALVLDDVAGLNGVAVDLHRRSPLIRLICLGKSARKLPGTPRAVNRPVCMLWARRFHT
jgi:hypothetical protein